MPTPLPEDRNWAALAGVSRRAALAGGTAALGFALAARPVAASRITTAREGLAEGMGTFEASGGFAMNVYAARPATGTGHPVILVVQEIFGLHEWIRDIARRLAHQGYFALAPDLFQRQGDPTRIADIPTLAREIVSRVPDAQVLADLDAAAAHAARTGGDARRLGITGFCWGGRITWLHAAHAPALRAGVAWYGRLRGEASALQPRHPIDVAATLKAPVLGLYGGRDRGIPVADVEAMREALKRAGSLSAITLFDDADHGFLADYRPSFHPEAAAAAWREALGWFATHLR
jgi:carboxymethylenebutenolidase